MHSSPYIVASTFVFGLLFGSFLNVLIYRLPRHKNVVAGRSQCPGCDAVVRWFDNVPLLANAIRAIEGEGTIRIETSVDSEYVYVKISDTGKGILPENMDQLFDPGFTTRGSGVGTGLGLSTSGINTKYLLPLCIHY